MARREPEEEPGTFTWPLLGALYGSLVIVGVIAILESRIGRHPGGQDRCAGADADRRPRGAHGNGRVRSEHGGAGAAGISAAVAAGRRDRRVADPGLADHRSAGAGGDRLRPQPRNTKRVALRLRLSAPSHHRARRATRGLTWARQRPPRPPGPPR